MTMTVSEIMTRQVITLPQSASLYDAQQLMKQHSIRHLPVCDGQQLTGLITQSDVLAALPPHSGDESAAERRARARGLAISDVMIRKLVTIHANTGIKQAALLLERNKFGCLPVIDKDNLITGLVTNSDFVAVAINLLETLEASEPDF